MTKFLKNKEYWYCVVEEFVWVSKWTGVCMYVIALFNALMNGNFMLVFLLLVSPLWLGLVAYIKS